MWHYPFDWWQSKRKCFFFCPIVVFWKQKDVFFHNIVPKSLLVFSKLNSEDMRNYMFWRILWLWMNLCSFKDIKGMLLTILCKLLWFIEFQFYDLLYVKILSTSPHKFSQMQIPVWDILSYLCLKGFRMSTYNYTQSRKNFLKKFNKEI